MDLINLLLRLSSIAILIIILYQTFLSKRGGPKHIFWGKVSMFLGILLVILVAIRGFHHNAALDIWYIVHLLLGTVFFIIFFITIFLGYRANTKKHHQKKDKMSLHGVMARITLYLLVFTLTVGILSVTMTNVN